MKGFNIRDLIGLILLGAFIGALGLLFWQPIPKANEQLIVYMLGQLSGFVSGVVALHYVTKAGEKEQEQQRVDNTTDALKAIRTAQQRGRPDEKSDALRPGDVVELGDPQETNNAPNVDDLMR